MSAFHLHFVLFVLACFAILRSGNSYYYTGKVYVGRKKVNEPYKFFAVEWEWRDNNGELDIYMTSDDNDNPLLRQDSYRVEIIRLGSAVYGQPVPEVYECKNCVPRKAGRYQFKITCLNTSRRQGSCSFTVTIRAVDCGCKANEYVQNSCDLNRDSARTCAPCSPGIYCDGSSSRKLCPAGFACPALTSSATKNNRPCKPTFYCPSGSASDTAFRCPAGVFCAGQAEDAGGNGRCLGGYFCPERSTTERGTGICAGGTYCLPGTRRVETCSEGRVCPEGTSVEQGTPCPTGNRCPTGTSRAFICAPGYRRTTPGQPACRVCDDGFYCPGTGDDGGRQPCIPGHFCVDGTMTPCSTNSFCPEGSDSEGPACYGFGTIAFVGACGCYPFVTGSTCEFTTSPITLANMSMASTAYQTEVLSLVENDYETKLNETFVDCVCGEYFDGSTCIEASTPGELLDSFFRGGVLHYEANGFALALHAFSKVATCSRKLSSVSLADIKDVLGHLSQFLEGQRSADFAGLSQEQSDLATYILVALEHSRAVADPRVYDFDFMFTAVDKAEDFYLAMMPPFKYCNEAGIEAFISDCTTEIENVLAFTRCAILEADDLSALTLVAQEMFFTQGLFCSRSLRKTIEENLGGPYVKLVNSHVADAAFRMDHQLGPSPNTNTLVNLATSAAFSYKVEDSDALIPVPAQPLSYFQNTLGTRIAQIQAFAAKIGGDARAGLLQDKLDGAQDRISEVISNGFQNLTGIVLELNVDVLESFQLESLVDVEVERTKLETRLEFMKTERERLGEIAREFLVSLEVLTTDRVDILLDKMADLIAIQYSVDAAYAARAKAQAAIDLVKGVLGGIVTIGLTLLGQPALGAFLGLGINLIPVRRRLEEEESKPQTFEDVMHTTSESRRELAGCDASTFFEEALKKLPKSYFDISKASFGTTGPFVFGLLFRTSLIAFDAARLAYPCFEDRPSLGSSQGAALFFASLLDVELGLRNGASGSQIANRNKGKIGGSMFMVHLALQLLNLNPPQAELDIEESIKPFLQCNSNSSTDERRRLAFKCDSLARLAGNRGILAFGALNLISAGLDIGLAVHDYYQRTAAADALAEQAIENEELNTQNLNISFTLLKDSLLSLNSAFIGIGIRWQFLQLGMDFHELGVQVLSYSDIVQSLNTTFDSFTFTPTIWDSIYNDIMDVIENRALICPPIGEETFIVGFSRRLKEKLSGRRLGSIEMKARRGGTRRATGPKAERREAQRAISEGNEQFRTVKAQLDDVDCPAFRSTLRSVVNAGKSLHEGMYALTEEWSKFEKTLTKIRLLEEKVSHDSTVVGRAERQRAEHLNSLDSGAARAEILSFLRIKADVDLNMQVLVLVDKMAELLEEFCNSHFYTNPARKPSVCSTDLFELQMSSGSTEEFLLQLADKLSGVVDGVTQDYFDTAYNGFAEFDDELLDVTEMVDLGRFNQTGYKNFSFTLSGPPEAAYNPLLNLSSEDIRLGPYFCAYDNIGMQSFGVLFLDSNFKIVGNSTHDIGLSITLGGPFIKTAAGVRAGFALKPYENVVYRYSLPKVINGDRFCRTDETPTLFGEICDKGRSFEIETNQLQTQPLPSPYARWDVKVTQGEEILREKGVAHIQVITKFLATVNSEMQCRGILSLPGSSVTSGGGDNSADATGMDVAAVAVASVFGILVAAALTGLVVRHRARQQNDATTSGEPVQRRSDNPMYKGTVKGEDAAERESMVVSNIKGSLASIETAFVELKEDMDKAL